jgi:hypothetical protein
MCIFASLVERSAQAYSAAAGEAHAGGLGLSNLNICFIGLFCFERLLSQVGTLSANPVKRYQPVFEAERKRR